MRGKTRFVLWETMTSRLMNRFGIDRDTASKTLSRGMQEMLAEGDEVSAAASINQIGVESVWERDCGRAYYKVYPGIARMLCHTSIDVPVDYIQPPYHAFNICLPAEDCPLPIHNGTVLVAVQHRSVLQEVVSSISDDLLHAERVVCDEAQSQIVRWERKRGFIVESLVVLLYQTAEDADKDVVSSTVFYLLKDKTIRESLEQFRSYWPEADAIIKGVALEQLMAIIFGVCCFASGQTEMIMPDLPDEPQVTRAKRHGKAAEALAQMEAEKAAQKRQRAIERCRGFLVGREIELPRWHQTATTEGEGEGTSHALEYSHLRSGHLRLQACGPKLQERKLIFVKPVMVRPDLPASPYAKGHRITDRILDNQ